MGEWGIGALACAGALFFGGLRLQFKPSNPFMRRPFFEADCAGAQEKLREEFAALWAQRLDEWWAQEPNRRRRRGLGQFAMALGLALALAAA